MKKLTIALITVFAATMLVLGLVADLSEERQQISGVGALIIFVLSLILFPLAYGFEQLSLRMGRWFSSVVGSQPYPNGQSKLLHNAKLSKGIALCFGAFGIGALIRFLIRGEQTAVISLAFLGFAVGFSVGIFFVEWLHRLINRDSTSVSRQMV